MSVSFDMPGLNQMLDTPPPGVIEEVSPLDGMYEYGPELYERAGMEALRQVRLATLAARLETVSSVLDFACGFGRVMRMLKAEFPDAALTGSDILEHGVEFCSRVFGARGIVSNRDLEKIELDGQFDLIWSGSLLTHLPPEAWPHLLRLWESVLVPGGVLVFTAYGRQTLEGVRAGTNTLNMTPEQAKKVLAEFDAKGVGFSETVFDGDCLTSRPWVTEQLGLTPSLRLLLFTESGWLGQDVIGCMKAPEFSAAA